MKVLSLLIFFTIVSETFGQQNDSTEKFFDCERITEKIKRKDNLTGLKEYNLYKYLLLDSTHVSIVKKINPSSVEAFRHDVFRSRLSTTTIGFKTNFKKIEQLLSDENELKKILTICSTYSDAELLLTRFNYPIYIDKNNAIFEIRSKSSVDWYIARLKDGTLQIDYVQGETWKE